MKHADGRSWLFLLLTLVVISLGCGSGATSDGGDPGGDGSNNPDGGDPDSSVGWDSGPQFPDDDDDFGGCTPKTCTQLKATCGPIDNGCGKLIDCGSCPQGLTCGAEEPNVCGAGECFPKSCDELGFECGQQGDGCESILDCGSCPKPEFCGGGGPNKCGRGVNCENLCKQQVTCPGAETTRLSGIVYNPAGTIPLYGALVYVPNAPLEHFPDEVSCGACEDEVSGKPLVVATTNAKGEFVLEDVPVGNDIPLVIQLGRWRKVVTIPTVEACEDNVAPASLTRLPQRHQEDGNPFNNIPRMAMVTGSIDALEQMLRKTGISCDEFKLPSFPDTGRIHFYQRNGATLGTGTPSQETLLNDPARMAKYDMILLACPASEVNTNWNDARRKNLADYTAAGGRLFTTHYGYMWIRDNAHGQFNTTATWTGSQSGSGAPTVDQSHPKGVDFADWLLANGAASVSGSDVTVPLTSQVHTVRSVTGKSLPWIRTTRPSVLHYTFDTPVAAPEENKCGRVLFSNFHVSASSSGNFATTCGSLALNPTAQEKVLQFMMFDLASCALPEAPSCTPRTCDDYGYECGPAGDGCGGILDCGQCEGAAVCGGAGPGKCGGGQCTPRTCQAQGIECGEAGDGCGNKINCGDCPAPQWCGGAGPGKCGGIK